MNNLVMRDVDDVRGAMHSLKETLVISTSLRRVTYKLLNTDTVIYDVYTKKKRVHESYIIFFSQLRVGGYSLTIETDRWNRHGRLSVEERLCLCGAVYKSCTVT